MTDPQTKLSKGTILSSSNNEINRLWIYPTNKEDAWTLYFCFLCVVPLKLFAYAMPSEWMIFKNNFSLNDQSILFQIFKKIQISFVLILSTKCCYPLNFYIIKAGNHHKTKMRILS